MDTRTDIALIELSGNHPLLMRDLQSVWQVTQGAVDIFAVSLQQGTIIGRREFLVRLVPGQGFIGLASAAHDADAEGAVTLLAVGGLETSIQRIDDPEAQAATIEAWIGALDRACRDSRDAWANSFAAEGEMVLEATHKVAAPAGRLFWCELTSGALTDADGAEIVTGGAPAAITAVSPLQATTGSTLTVETTHTVLMSGRLPAALDDYYWRIFPALERLLTQREAARIEFGRRSEEATQARVAEGIQSLAGVGRGRLEAAIAPGAKPAWRALAAVAAVLGQEITLPTDLADVGMEGRGIQGLAEACGLRSRLVVLKAGWWLEKNGPLMTTLAANNEAVALLPEKGGYVIWNPATGERTRVNEEVGLSVRPQAVMLYRRFSDAPITVWRLMGFSLRRNGLRVLALLFMAILGGVMGLFVPFAVGTLVDKIIPRSAIPELAMLSAGLVVVAVSSGCVALVRALIMQQMEQQVDLAAQSALFDRMLRLPVSFLKSYSIGDLADRVVGLQSIRQVLTGATLSSAMAGMMSMMNIVMMLSYSGKLALFGIGAAIVSGIISSLLVILQLRRERALAASRGRSESVVLQLITGIGKLKAAAAVGRAHALWANAYARQRDNFVRAQWAGNYQSIFQSMFMPISMVVLYYMAAKAILPAASAAGGEGADAAGPATAAAAALSAGAFLGFSSAYGQLIGGVSGLVGALSAALRIIPTYERAKPLLTTKPETASDRMYPGVLNGRIEFADVTFRYPNTQTPVLQNLSFEVEPGQFVAIVGPSGSGKSTILRLLVGFESPEEGDILYDGKPLSSLDVVGVRRQLGVVLQNGRVQPVSMLENIGGGRPITLNDAWDAARKAGLEDDIKNMPMGMHTGLTDGGSTLSGGQRQRLMIARALASRPRMLLLDEATSALDNRTQAIVTETVSRLSLTRIIIAHRLSTIASVDRVLVIDHGRIVQDGSFKELMETPGLFRELAQRQLT